MTNDAQLLREYVRDRSEPAFGELVSRHIDLVYSAALRVVAGDTHLAEDVAQVVFCDLARKAANLPPEVVLPGWLHQHTCFTASKAVRTECRRRNREQTALAMSANDEDNPPPQWERIAPHLDEGLGELSPADRDAIVLRFLKQQDLQTVGASLGISEDAAQKRVSRALEKLRTILSRRGVALSAAALASVLTAETVTAAPAGLALSVASAALAGAATLGTGVGIATTTKVIAMTKLQLAVAGSVLVAGLATSLAFQHQSLERLRQANSELAVQNQTLSLQSNELARLQAQNQRLSSQLALFTQAPPVKADQKTELLKLRGEVSRLHAAVANPPKTTNSLAAMFKDPSMKDFMKTMLATTVDKQYGRIFSQMQLTEEQTATLKDLLVKKSLAGADLGVSALTGDTDPAKRKELMEQARKETAAVEDQIKEFLGADSYSQFQTYEKNLIDYTTLTMFEDQLPKSAALSANQEQQLIQLMGEERNSFKFTTDFSKDKQNPDNLSAMFAEDKLAQRQQEQEQLNQRYLARAQSVLSPAQLGSFESYLANQAKMQTATMRMSAQMLNPKPAGN